MLAAVEEPVKRKDPTPLVRKMYFGDRCALVETEPLSSLNLAFNDKIQALICVVPDCGRSLGEG